MQSFRLHKRTGHDEIQVLEQNVPGEVLSDRLHKFIPSLFSIDTIDDLLKSVLLELNKYRYFKTILIALDCSGRDPAALRGRPQLLIYSEPDQDKDISSSIESAFEKWQVYDPASAVLDDTWNIKIIKCDELVLMGNPQQDEKEYFTPILYHGKTAGFICTYSSYPDHIVPAARMIRVYAELIAYHINFLLGMEDRSLKSVETIGKALKDAVVLLDDKLDVIYKNDKANQILRPLIRHTDSNYITHIGGHELDAWIQMMTDNNLLTDKKEISADGNIYDISLTRIVSNKPGEMMSFLVIEEKTMERNDQYRSFQNSKTAALTQLTSNLAHEINNPLTTILGLSDYNVATDPEDQKYGDWLMIHKEALRLKEMVTKWLTFSGTGDESLPLDLNKIIYEVITISDHQLSELKITLHKNLTILPTLTGFNKPELNRIVLNLLQFSIEHIKAFKQGDSITLTTYFKQNFIFMDIENNGKPFSNLELEHLCIPFYQDINNVCSGNLDLAMSWQLLYNKHAVLEMLSRPDSGFIMRCKFPMMNK
jgi:nitrogen-specific signal transduction histidine kinase